MLGRDDAHRNIGEQILDHSQRLTFIAIPESGSPAHVKENAVALALTFTPQELQTLDAAYPRH
jgi:diketogulonate reductase-like aldo/keto reductase